MDYRKRRTRIGLLLGLAVVAAVSLLVAYWYIPPLFSSKGPPSPRPIGVLIVFGNLTATRIGSSLYYNTTIAAVNTTTSLSDLEFAIANSRGGYVAPAPGWQVGILPGSPVGMSKALSNYSLTNETWSIGAATLIASGQVVSLYVSSTNLSGDYLVAFFVHSGSGQLLLPIP